MIARRRSRDQSGTVALLIVFLTVVLVGVLAFVTDFGLAYTNKRILQNGVDAAVLAVAQDITEQALPTDTCENLRTTFAGLTQETAERYFADNGAPADAQISTPEIQCPEAGESGPLLVSATATQRSPNFFGPIFGPDHANGILLRESAKAAVGPARSVLRARPIGICTADAEVIKSDPDHSHYILFSVGTSDDETKPCSATPGDWGLLELDGSKNGGTSEVRDWISDGYDQPVTRAESVPECTDTEGCILAQEGGVGNDLDSSMNDLLHEKEFLAPVYDTVTKAAGDRYYKITGFISLQLCGWDFNKKDPSESRNLTSSCFDPFLTPTPVDTDWIQVQYSGFVPIGDISKGCSLGTPSCDYGVRVFKLAQ